MIFPFEKRAKILKDGDKRKKALFGTPENEELLEGSFVFPAEDVTFGYRIAETPKQKTREPVPEKRRPAFAII